MDQPEIKRGVLVDPQGFFLGAFQWEAGTPAPKFNTKAMRNDPAKRLHLLTEDAALNVPSAKARWDFNAKAWVLPETRFFIVEESTGRLCGGVTEWPERLRGLPPGKVYVDTPPPPERARRSVWNAGVQEWQDQIRVLLVTPEGVVDNIVLESPLASAHKIAVPKGWKRFDDKPGTRSPWPKTWDGLPVGIGCRMNAQGAWEQPGRPQPPDAPA
ncbi:MAG: hypothetical protein OEZ19_00100 [Paracoccaceae bacterium]|nr:hypothetical protein [Paracoccaceae bacterium]